MSGDSTTILPHGGALVNRVIAGEEQPAATSNRTKPTCSQATERTKQEPEAAHIEPSMRRN